VTVGTGGNMLKNIQSVTTGNTFTTSPIKGTDTGITALYCRLSQDDGNVGDSDSIINQKKILAEYAERNGYTPYQFYIDDGFSGTNFERPQFKQMIEDAKKGTVKRIICKDLSRFGRDYIKVGLYTEFIFPDKDIHFIAVNDDVDSNVQKDNDLAPFKNLFNEWYARDTSKKIKAVKKAKGLEGEHMSCVAPYGYRKNPDNPKEWLIDEESAEVVREIFRLCVDGYGPRRIANILTERKILIPSAYALEKGYAVRNNIPKNPCQWSSTVVVDVLERMDYLGHTVNFKTHRKSYKQKKKIENDKSEWKIFENTHEPIIDKSTFDIVQKIRANRKRPTKMGEMPMFSGILYCADCGKKLSFHRRANDPDTKHNFVCSNYRSDTHNCSMHYIRNVVVEQLVLENLREVVSYVKAYEDEFVQMVMDADIKQKSKELAKKKRVLSDKEKRYTQLDGLFQRIYEDNVSGKLSDERFVKLSQGYEAEQKDLQSEIEALRMELSQEEQQSVNVKSFLSTVKKYTEIPELTSEIVHEFIDRIIVHEADKSSGKRIQEIEIIYNHIGVFDRSKVNVYMGKAV
jgi:DNA invertase Pin-like site-specific DNA recombinase